MDELNEDTLSMITRWSKSGIDNDVHSDELSAIPDELWGDPGSESYEAVMSLKSNERRVLWVLLESCFLEEPLTVSMIAKRAGVNSLDIPIMRSRERFGHALTLTILGKLRGFSDVVVGHLYRQSAMGKNTATKLLLELCKLYQPVSRVMSMNVNVDASDMRGKSSDDVQDDVVQEWKKMGWTKADFDKLWKKTN